MEAREQQEQGEKRVTCVQRVSGGDAWARSRHCSRSPGFGPSSMYCRQHAERHSVVSADSAITWYKTSNWNFAIEEVSVVSVSEKTLLVKHDYATKPSRQNKHGEYHHYWPTREDAIESLRKRIESKREALANAEAEFRRTCAGRGDNNVNTESSLQPETEYTQGQISPEVVSVPESLVERGSV